MRLFKHCIKKVFLDLKAHEGLQILLFGVRENSRGLGVRLQSGKALMLEGRREEGEGEEREGGRKGGKKVHLPVTEIPVN